MSQQASERKEHRRTKFRRRLGLGLVVTGFALLLALAMSPLIPELSEAYGTILWKVVAISVILAIPLLLIVGSYLLASRYGYDPKNGQRH